MQRIGLTGGQIGSTTTIRVVGDHHPPVSLLDFGLGQGGLPQTEDLGCFLLVHLGVESAFDPFARWTTGTFGTEQEVGCESGDDQSSTDHDGCRNGIWYGVTEEDGRRRSEGC